MGIMALKRLCSVCLAVLSNAECSNQRCDKIHGAESTIMPGRCKGCEVVTDELSRELLPPDLPEWEPDQEKRKGMSRGRPRLTKFNKRRDYFRNYARRKRAKIKKLSGVDWENRVKYSKNQL